MKVYRLFVLVLVFGCAATNLHAQEAEAFGFDNLVFGVSGKADVEKVYNGRLSCAAVEERVEHCKVIGSVYSVEATFVDGTLRYLRMLLPYGVYPEAVVADLRTRWGPVVKSGMGHGNAEGLRYWTYRPVPGAMGLLEGVRNRSNGQQRLRLSILDGRGGWLPQAGH